MAVFLFAILGLVTLLLCYAGYIFLIVDRREDAKVLEDPDLFDALDSKNYDFILPEEVDKYEDLRLSEPTDKCVPPAHQQPSAWQHLERCCGRAQRGPDREPSESDLVAH